MFSSIRKSSDNDAPPQPTVFSPQQMSNYLSDLRTNRPARPTGARPVPSTCERKNTVKNAYLPEHETLPTSVEPPRHDHRVPSAGHGKRNVSTSSTSSRGAISLYNEKDERQRKERKVSHEVSAALQKLDLEEEERLHKSAQEEADELIRKHKRPTAPYSLQPGPWKGMRPRPVHTDGSASTRQTRDVPVPEIALATGSIESPVRPARPAQPSKQEDKPVARMPSMNAGSIQMGKQRSSTKFDPFSISNLANRRRSSGSKRLASGGSPKSLFVNPEDKIYEDPIDRQDASKEETVPVHVRRNPFARMRSKREALPSPVEVPSPISNRITKSERQNSLPSQARGAGYTSNTAHMITADGRRDSAGEAGVTYRDGLEVRSDELRAATSLRMKDRSPKLPTPTGVSDSHSRPIVSFKPDWAPPQSDTAPTSSPAFSSLPFRVRTGRLMEEPTKRSSLELLLVKRDSPPPSPQRQELYPSSIPTINLELADGPNKKQRLWHSPTTLTSVLHDIPSISVTKEVPSITVSPEKVEQPLMPTISITNDDEPSPVESNISMSRFPPPPTVSIGPTPSAMPQVETFTASRPAPLPPVPSRPVMSRYQSIRRTTATCANCNLPISGRVVTAASSLFHPACFRCHHCSTTLEHVSFYPEPSSHRQARLDRITARRDGTYYPQDPESEEQLAYDDGWDETTHFYCHLDYHEQFSPRCKNCKTPIEGEVVVALGASWHPDHFFCAECGDPFKAETPFVEKEGYAWCVACHTHRTSAKCRGCKRPVVDVVVSALGAEWHEECFRCVMCKGGFEEGRFWVRKVVERGERGRADKEVDMPVCGGCEEKRLKM